MSSVTRRRRWLLAFLLLISTSKALFDEAELIQIAARSADAGGHVVVTSASISYVAVLLNWVVAIEAAGCSSWMVVCLDEPLATFLDDHGIPCVRSFAKTNSQIWSARTAMLESLLRAGHSVTLADTDAVWLQDARPWLINSTEFHVLASRGSFPSWAHKEWGAALCMGLAHFRAGAATLQFVKRIAKLTLQFKDDQRAANAALREISVAWRERMSYVESTTVTRGRATLPSGQELRVGLLPHDRFKRVCGTSEGVVVLHCYVAKTGAAKRVVLREQGAWFLREDFASVEPTATWLLDISTRQHRR